MHKECSWFRRFQSKERSQFPSQRFCYPRYVSGYNVPTRIAPKFGLRVLALFDASVKMIIPAIGHEINFDNTKVMHTPRT